MSGQKLLKDKRIHVRVNETELAEIHQFAKENNTDISKYVLNAVYLYEDLVSGYKMLNGLFADMSKTDGVIKDYTKLSELIKRNVKPDKIEFLNKKLRLE